MQSGVVHYLIGVQHRLLYMCVHVVLFNLNIRGVSTDCPYSKRNFTRLGKDKFMDISSPKLMIGSSCPSTILFSKAQWLPMAVRHSKQTRILFPMNSPTSTLRHNFFKDNYKVDIFFIIILMVNCAT